MTSRLSLLLGTLVALLSSCCVPPGETCRSYSPGPAFNGDGHLYPRPSNVADHSYPTSFEPVHHYREPTYTAGAYGYGTDCNAQIPYFYR
jgi:hypothetical protein